MEFFLEALYVQKAECATTTTTTLLYEFQWGK